MITYATTRYRPTAQSSPADIVSTVTRPVTAGVTDQAPVVPAAGPDSSKGGQQ